MRVSRASIVAIRAVWAGVVLAAGLGLAACGNSERAGADEAKRQADQEAKAQQTAAPAAKKLATPVPGHAHVPCTQLIDPAVFQTALGEKEPLTVKDVTKTEPDAAASCSLVRGGKRPGDAEQKAILKREGRLGVLPGDELCNVTAFCSTIEDSEHFKARCKERKDSDDETLGSYACVHVVAVGADDVKVFRLLDEDTRCILQIRGGPSNTRNDTIQSCAKAARDAIGPAQIKIDATTPAGAAAGSG
jgi:hypothetical protein